MAVGDAPAHKLVFQRVQDVNLLLAHGLAQFVGLSLGEAGQLLGQKHHLFLVHRYAVGILQVLFHLGKVVFNGLFSLFSGYEIRDVIHGTGPIQGVHSNQVLKTGGTQLLQPGFHAFRFKLEHGSGVSAAVKVISGSVVNGDGLYVDILSMMFFDQVQAIVDDGQGDKAQEVHLKHAHIFNIVAVVLRSAHVLPRFLILGQADGQIIGKVSAADDGGTGVNTHLAHTALQGFGIFKDLLIDLGAVFEFFDELRHQAVTVFERNLDIHVFHAHLEGLHDTVLFPFYLFEAGLELVQLGIEGIFFLFFLAQAVRNHLGETVALVNGDAGDARHVLDGTLGRHGTKRDDAGHVGCSIFVFHVIVRLCKVLKINVYIRHGNTVRIEESLEQELVSDGVQVGDFEAIGHYGTGGGTTSRAHHAAHGTGGGDVVLHNEEIVRETHAADGL